MPGARCGGITFLSFSGHLFELFRAENAEKVISPHLGSSLARCERAENAEKLIPPASVEPGVGNHLFELFKAENAEKLIPPHLGLPGPPGARCGGITFLSFSGLKMPKS